jgi:hypothetical protein
MVYAFSPPSIFAEHCGLARIMRAAFLVKAIVLAWRHKRRRAGYPPTRPITAGTLHPAGYRLRSSSTTSAGSCTRSPVLSTAVGRAGARPMATSNQNTATN